MRAILAVIAVVVLIAIVGPPYWFGKKAEDEYNNVTQAVSEVENLKIVKKSYTRGWFKSMAEITYSINNNGAGNFEIIEKDTIYHGPIPFGLLGKGRLSLRPVMAVIESKAKIETDSNNQYSVLLDSLKPIDLYTTLSLDGYGTSEISIEGVEKKFEDGRTAIWSGLDGLIDFTQDLGKVSFVVNSPALEIQDDTFLMQINGINIESSMPDPLLNYYNYKYPLGDVSISIDEFLSEGKDGNGLDRLSLSNFTLTSSTTESGPDLNGLHSVSFGTVNIGGNDYGPGGYEIEIRNLNKSAFMEIQQALNDNQNIPDTELSRELLRAKILSLLPKLMESSPEIELSELSLKTGEGELRGHALISLKGDPELASNPLLLLAALYAEMKLSVSKPLFESVFTDYKIEEITDEFHSQNKELPEPPELSEMASSKAKSEIQQWLDLGLLVLKDGDYVIEANYELGQIKINGNPLDMSSLFDF